MHVVKDKVKEQRLLYFILLIVSLIKGFLNVALAIILQNLIDSLNYTTKSQIISDILSVIIFISILVITNIVYSYLSALITKRILFRVKGQTVRSIMRLSMAELFKTNTANYISLLTNHIQDLESDYLNSIINLVDMIITLVFSAGALVYLSPIVGLIALIASLIALLFPAILSGKGNEQKNKYSDSQEEATKLTKDLLSGFELIKGYHVEKKVEEAYGEKNKMVEISRFKYNFTVGIIMGISMFMGYIVFFSVVISGLILSLNNIVSVGTLIACVNLSNGLVNPIMNGLQEFFKIKSMKGIEKKFDINTSHVNNANIEIKEFKNIINFKNVCYSYENNFRINNLNFTIESGKKYAIVGNSGSGKSTLLKLLMGHLYNYTGEILIDDYELSNIKNSSLCNIYSVVNQNPFLFDVTIEENVKFYQDISEKDIRQAMVNAGLESFVKTKSHNIESLVGEEGNQISGGEKQRIAIARALARNSDIILLDEATSNLDNNISIAIEKILLNSSSTIVSVTHKLIKETLSYYDQILTMNNGEIVEMGSFEELIERKGLFYSLFYINNV